LVQNGKLPGSIRGQEYIPDVYWTLQRTAVDTFFAENGYLHHAKARELQVHKPLNFVRESFPEALDLETAVVSPSMVEWLEASLEGAVVQKSWVEVPLKKSVCVGGGVGIVAIMVPLYPVYS
ncbi:unnamed protein product, partial [Choristocarpus tenellus]